MSDQETVYTFRGECSCGWRGSMRWSSADADTDLERHCKETGCRLRPSGSIFHDDDLMPHERIKLEREREAREQRDVE